MLTFLVQSCQSICLDNELYEMCYSFEDGRLIQNEFFLSFLSFRYLNLLVKSHQEDFNSLHLLLLLPDHCNLRAQIKFFTCSLHL